MDAGERGGEFLIVMGCDVSQNGEVTTIVCTRGRKTPKLCPLCGRNPAILLCDFPTPGETQTGTCDQEMCPKCAKTIAKNKHFCPNHADKWDGHQFMKPLFGKETECALCGKPPDFHRKKE